MTQLCRCRHQLLTLLLINKLQIRWLQYGLLQHATESMLDKSECQQQVMEARCVCFVNMSSTNTMAQVSNKMEDATLL